MSLAAVDLKAAFAGVNGRDVLLAVLALVAAWIAGRLARRAVVRVLGRVDGISADLRQLAGRLTKYFVYAIGVGVALSFLGASLQPILAAVIIVAVVTVLALRGIADNFAAGIVMQTRRPVQLGDEIETLGFTGVVRDMNGRSVILETSDGRQVHVPNSKILANPLVKNRSASRGTEIEVRADRAAGIDEIVKVISDAAVVEGVVRDPAPVVLVTAAEPKRVIIRLRVWHEPSLQPRLGSRVVSSIAEALRAHGIDATVMTPPPAVPPTPSATM